MAAALLTLTAQVVLGRWAYLAYEHGPVECAEVQPNCVALRLYNAEPPWEHVPVWAVIAAWFAVDLAILLLGVCQLARWDATQGIPWSRKAVGQRSRR